MRSWTGLSNGSQEESRLPPPHLSPPPPTRASTTASAGSYPPSTPEAWSPFHNRLLRLLVATKEVGM